MSDRLKGAWPDVRRASRLVPGAAATVVATSLAAVGTAAARGSSAVGALTAGILVPLLVALVLAVGLGAAFAGVTAWAATTVQGRREVATEAFGLLATVTIVAVVWTVLPGISSPRAPRINATSTPSRALPPADVRVGNLLLTPSNPIIGPRPQPTPRSVPQQGVSRTGSPVVATPRTNARLIPVSGPAAPEVAPPAGPGAPEPASPPVVPVAGRLGRPAPPDAEPPTEPAVSPPARPTKVDEPADSKKQQKKQKRTHRHGPKVRGHQHSPEVGL